MKTKWGLITLITFLALAECTAQNLQYGQVKLVTSSEQVPSGRIWKISNMLPNTRLTSTEASGNNNTVTQSTQQAITVNGNTIYLATSDAKGRAFSHYDRATASANASALSIISGDIWLPEGTTLAAGSGVYALSVIEFIVAP